MMVLCMCMCVFICEGMSCVCRHLWRPEEGIRPLRLELQGVASPCHAVGAKKQTLGIHKNRFLNH